MAKTKLKTINEIDFKTVKIGDKLNFLYQSSSKKWGGKKEDVMIPVILKDDYFNDFISSLKKNKVTKNKRIKKKRMK